MFGNVPIHESNPPPEVGNSKSNKIKHDRSAKLMKNADNVKAIESRSNPKRIKLKEATSDIKEP